MKYDVLVFFLLTSIFVAFFLGYLFQPVTCNQPQQVTIVDLLSTQVSTDNLIYTVMHRNSEGEVNTEDNVSDDIFYSLQIGDTAYVRYCKGDWISIFHYTFFDGKERIEQ